MCSHYHKIENVRILLYPSVKYDFLKERLRKKKSKITKNARKRRITSDYKIIITKIGVSGGFEFRFNEANELKFINISSDFKIHIRLKEEILTHILINIKNYGLFLRNVITFEDLVKDFGKDFVLPDKFLDFIEDHPKVTRLIL